MPSLVKPILTEHQMLKYQRRLSSFLKDHEYKHNRQMKEVAEQFDMAPQKFSLVKSSSKPYTRFVNSLDLLARFARLENMSIGEFVAYLEGENKEEPGDAKRKLYSWEKTIIDAFEPITAMARGKFLELCKESQREGKRKLEAMIELNNLLADRDAEAIEHLRDAVRGMKA